MDEFIKTFNINWPTLIAQIVNFVILFGVLYLVAYKPVMKMLDERAGKIKESVDQAEHISQQAAEAEKEARARLEEAGREGREVVSRAVQSAEEVRQQAQQDARKEAQLLINRAQTEIQHEKETALDELRKEFADLTILAAEKVIDSSLDKEKHLELIEKTIEASISRTEKED